MSTLNGLLNTSVGNDVASANQLLSDIASLNDQIAKATASGGNANDLVDSREQDLENLSKLVNIQTAANSDGTVSVSIGGQDWSPATNSPTRWRLMIPATEIARANRDLRHAVDSFGRFNSRHD